MKSHFALRMSATTFITNLLLVNLFQDVSAFTSTIVGRTLKESIVKRSDHCHHLYAEHPSLPTKESPTPASPGNEGRVSIASDAFLKEYFQSEIDDINLPPSMSILHRSISELASGSDVRGRFINHPATGRMAGLARSIGQTALPAITPFAAHCLGFAFATMIKEYHLQAGNDEEIAICIGRDPREHGIILADSFARGAGGLKGVKVFYTGIATTPALFEFCR